MSFFGGGRPAAPITSQTTIRKRSTWYRRTKNRIDGYCTTSSAKTN